MARIIELKVPQSLAQEAEHFACPDTWRESVIGESVTKGKFEIVKVSDEDVDSFLQGLAAAADIEQENNDKARGKRWKKQVQKLIQDTNALGVPTHLASRYLSL